MTRSKLLTIEDLIDELDMGKATLKFILHRFSPWLATQIVNDETCYTEQAVTTLLKIKQFLDTGMLPGQIEASLVQEAEMLKATASIPHPASNQGTIPVDMESVSLFKDMLQVFIEKQDRIVLAQEALARVEERKTNAMEKRAAAEEKKAAAMTNIALALQEMNQRYNAAPQAMEIAGRAVETLALEEAPGLDQTPLDTNFNEDNDEDLDDLFSLVDMDSDIHKPFHEDLDDLSKLIDSDDEADVADWDDLSALIKEPEQPQEPMDDLSKLIEPASDERTGDLDDLSALIEEPEQPQESMDDLSRLIGPASDEHTGDLDDLSALIEEPEHPQGPMDDLSRFIEPASDERSGDLDDLSALIEEPEQPQEPMDDLSKLVGGTGEKSAQMPPGLDTQVKETPSIKPDISPDQDMGKYKAAVMKIIIELKGQGLTAQQTTDRLNRDGVTTLSGKPAWGLKAIDKIYGFIDSTK